MSDEVRSALSGIEEIAGGVSSSVHPLDDLDVALLSALAEDARASQRALAKLLGVSTPTVSERMTRLERAGVIRGYTAEIDWAAVGFGETVYMTVSAVADYDVADIMRRLWEIPEVEEVHLVTGELDLLVRLRVRGSQHLKQLMMSRLWQIPGIQRSVTMTSVVEMPHKNFSADLLRSMREPADTNTAQEQNHTAGR